MSFDIGQLYVDDSVTAGHQLYVHDGSSTWTKVAAVHDGGAGAATNWTVRGQCTLENNIWLEGENSGGTAYDLAQVDSGNTIRFGDGLLPINQYGSTYQFLVNTVTQYSTVSNFDIQSINPGNSGVNIYRFGSASTSYLDLVYDGSSIGKIDTSSQFNIQINGTNELEITNTNFTVRDARTVMRRTVTGDVVSRVNAANGSYTGTALQVLVDKNAATDFNYAVFDANGGTFDREFRFRGGGNGTCDGSWSGGGADFAEFMEWEDGNPSAEDRTGKTVVAAPNPDGKPMIKLASAGDIPIGVVSARPTVIGNSDWNKWQGKYEKDNYGRYKTVPVDMVKWTVKEKPQANSERESEISSLESDPLTSEDDNQQLDLCNSIKGELAEKRKRLSDVDYEISKSELLKWDTFSETRTAIKQKEKADFIAEKSLLENEIETLKLSVETETTKYQKIKSAKKAKQKSIDKQIPEEKWKEKPIVYEVAKLGGITPPPEAEYYTEERRKENPAFDSNRNHKPREDRQEWATIGLVGLVVIEDNQPVDPRWINFGPCGRGVSRWLIR